MELRHEPKFSELDEHLQREDSENESTFWTERITMVFRILEIFYRVVFLQKGLLFIQEFVLVKRHSENVAASPLEHSEDFLVSFIRRGNMFKYIRREHDIHALAGKTQVHEIFVMDRAHECPNGDGGSKILTEIITPLKNESLMNGSRALGVVDEQIRLLWDIA